MIRSELIGKLVETQAHLPRPVVEAALDAILNEIVDGLAQGHRVEVRGFGGFSSKVRDARIGRNPMTGEPVQVALKRHLHFKPSKLLLKQLNDFPAPD